MFWETKRQLLEEYSTKLFELYNIHNSIYIEDLNQDIQDIFIDKLVMNLQYIIDSNVDKLEEEYLYEEIYKIEHDEQIGREEQSEQVIMYSALYDLIQFISKDELQSLRNGVQLQQLIEEEE